MVRAQRTQLNLLAAAFVAGTVAIACGGGDDGDKPAGGSPDSGTPQGGAQGGAAGGGGTLTIAFNPMYSAYDGEHEFKVPVKVTGAKGKLTVTTDPADFVDSTATADGVMLTTRKAGMTTVNIKDEEGNSGSATLTVTENDPGDVEIGRQRYANGIDAFTLPEGGIRLPEGGFMFPEGGFPEGGFTIPEGGIRFPEGGLGITRNEMAACTFCHIPEGAAATGAEMNQVDVEHTPQQTAGYSDEDIIKIFTEAKKPEGAGYRVVNGGGLLPDNIASGIYARFHKWNVDVETQQGLVAYLRSLTPKAQGMIDFGGLLRGGIPGTMRMDAGAP